MASHQFIAKIRAEDPLWYRIAEVCVALAVIGSNWLSDSIEDGVARIWKRMHH